jgi:NlpC/P60 family protein
MINRKNKSKSIASFLLLLIVVVEAIMIIWPVNFGIGRVIILAGILAFWAILFIIAKHKFIRILLLVPILIVLYLAILPGGDYDREELRREYIKQLNDYEGVSYLWGGENSLGVDCSGLVRKAMINACLDIAYTEKNSGLLKEAVYLWWNDFSAKSMKDAYKGITYPKFMCESINGLKHCEGYESLQPGDLAVTHDGVHVLAYLGDEKWIAADPDIGKVVLFKVPDHESRWFREPVYIISWDIFN